MTLLATFLVLASYMNPNYINYPSPSDDYTIDIVNGIIPQRVAQKSGYLDVFQFVDTANGSKGPGYMLTILRTRPSGDFHFTSLTSKQFQEGYESGCNCKVTSNDEIQYNKEKGVSYAIKYKKEKTPMVGYTVTFQKGNNLFIVNFSTTEAAMGIYYNDYFHVINSFDMHPSQMIVGNKYRNHPVGNR